MTRPSSDICCYGNKSEFSCEIFLIVREIPRSPGESAYLGERAGSWDYSLAGIALVGAFWNGPVLSVVSCPSATRWPFGINFRARGTLRSPKLAAWKTNPLWVGDEPAVISLLAGNPYPPASLIASLLSVSVSPGSWPR